MYEKSFCKPLRTIFRSCLGNGKFSSELKNSMWLLSSKKKKNNNNKHMLKHYRPISLLPFSGKIFGRLLNHFMFKVFTENSLILQNNQALNQATLVLTSSCQLRIKSSHEVRSVFLGMSKVLGKVCHKSLIFKLNEKGISSNFLSTLNDFLKI